MLNDPPLSPPSEGFEYLCRVIALTLKAIHFTFSLTYGPWFKDNIYVYQQKRDILRKLHIYYQHTYSILDRSRCFILTTPVEKNALGLAYATLGDLLWLQIKKFWPQHWKTTQKVSLYAIMHYAKALCLSEERIKPLYIHNIKAILDTIEKSLVLNLLKETLPNPWLIKGLWALIDSYLQNQEFEMALHYAKVCQIKLGIPLEQSVIALIQEKSVFSPPPLESVITPSLRTVYFPSHSPKRKSPKKPLSQEWCSSLWDDIEQEEALPKMLYS